MPPKEKTVSWKKLLGASLIAMTLTTGCYATMGPVMVPGPPPPLRAELVYPPPYPGAVWAHGHWRWNGNRFVWIRGRYVRPRVGYAWTPARCWQTPGGWSCNRGYWRPL